MTIVRCVHEAAVDQDGLIRAQKPEIQKLESVLASDPHRFFSEFADKDSTRKGSRSDPIDKNVVFSMSMYLTLREIADMIEEMRDLPKDHEYYHLPCLTCSQVVCRCGRSILKDKGLPTIVNCFYLNEIVWCSRWTAREAGFQGWRQG